MLMNLLGISRGEIAAGEQQDLKTQLVETRLSGIRDFKAVVVNTKEPKLQMALAQLPGTQLPELLILTENSNQFATSTTASILSLLMNKTNASELLLTKLARWGTFAASIDYSGRESAINWIKGLSANLMLPEHILQRLLGLIRCTIQLSSSIETLTILSDGSIVYLVAGGIRTETAPLSRIALKNSLKHSCSEAVIIIDKPENQMQIAHAFRLEANVEKPGLLIYCNVNDLQQNKKAS
jgi:hypothetical protein